MAKESTAAEIVKGLRRHDVKDGADRMAAPSDKMLRPGNPTRPRSLGAYVVKG